MPKKKRSMPGSAGGNRMGPKTGHVGGGADTRTQDKYRALKPKKKKS